MSRLANRLTALKVDKLRKPGLYADGNGLWLRITPSGTKNWVRRYSIDHKPRYMGLGPIDLVSLSEARQTNLDARKLQLQGSDPIEQRRAQRAGKRLSEAKAVTFQECAEKYIDAHRAGWKHPKHVEQWENSLSRDVYPAIGKLSVAAIDTGLVMKVLEPIWLVKTETATRVRGRIESILDWAKTRGFRAGENPARWKGHIQNLLPAKRKVKKRGHYVAMPYDDVPAFMVRLRGEQGVAARALEFLILTAVRLSDLVGSEREDRTAMLWPHVSNGVWIIPATKNEGEHRVPLCNRAMAILKEMKDLGDQVVFPEINDDSLRYVLSYRLKVPGTVATIHGFRSSFKDWAAETTDFPDWVSEKALAHLVGDETRRAYQRGDLLEKRRAMMAAWAAFCTGKKGKKHE